MVKTYNRKPNTKCIICGKGIYRRPFEIEKNKNKFFCSASCYGINCRKEIHCLSCGKKILSGFGKRTCSRACANKYRTGIKYHIGSPRDKVKSQYFLKARLLKVRGLKCERCSYDKYKILQVHHKDRNRDNNDLNNLELICPNCHYEEHILKKHI